MLIGLRLPGLEHRLAHDGCDAAGAVEVLASATGGRLRGHQVWLSDATLSDALAWCGREIEGLGVAAAVGHGEVRRAADGTALGLEALRVGRALELARQGECLLTPAALQALELPDGVGVFRAPDAVADALGHPVHVARDYR